MITEQRAAWARNSAAYRVRHPGRQVAANARCLAKPLNRAVARDAQTAYLTANPIVALIRQARARAKRKGIMFDIVAADLLPLPKVCPVLGLTLQYGPGRGRKLYENGCAASLDRVRNSEGYVRGNVIVVSLRANLLKGQATLDELQKIAAFYSKLGERVS